MERDDLVPDDYSEKNVIDEANRRSCLAGYTNRHGEPTGHTKIMSTVPFGKVKLNIWPRDEKGNLVP